MEPHCGESFKWAKARPTFLGLVLSDEVYQEFDTLLTVIKLFRLVHPESVVRLIYISKRA